MSAIHSSAARLHSNALLLKAFIALCLLGSLPVSALAANEAPASPFGLTDQAWSPLSKPNPPAAAIATPQAAAASQPSVAVDAVPPVASEAPARLSLPNATHGYEIRVNSTAEMPPDSDGAAMAAVPALPDQNWQAAAEAAREQAITNGDTIDEQGVDHRPLAVRLSFLPDPTVAPKETEEAGAHKRPKNIAAAMPKKPVATAGGPQVNPADLAAIAAYRKAQLDAIEGDRDTLTNLQKAIATLGLNQQLDFLTGDQQATASTTVARTAAGPATKQALP